MPKGFLVPWMFISSFVLAQGGVQELPKKNLTPEQIVGAFAEKETTFYDAWIQYTYRQIADIRIVSINGVPSRERLTLISEVIFRDDRTREVRQVQKRGRLMSVAWTPEDTEVVNNLQPFALTSKELPLYNLKYEGKERVDELDCHVYSVKPKSTRGGKIYFDGKIWVDTEDLQIVRTIGRPVPQRSDNKFPAFETIRQMIDDQYWFPVWTHADDRLNLGGNIYHIEETVTYENYRRFGSKATIDFGPAKPPLER